MRGTSLCSSTRCISGISVSSVLVTFHRTPGTSHFPLDAFLTVTGRELSKLIGNPNYFLYGFTYVIHAGRDTMSNRIVIHTDSISQRILSDDREVSMILGDRELGVAPRSILLSWYARSHRSS